MNNELILNILYQALGHGKKTARDNYAFKCPNNCHPTKPKLEINIETHQYQCWICGGQENGFKGKNLVKLLKKINTHPDKINEMRSLTGNTNVKGKKEYTYEQVKLPKEFKSILNNSSITAKRAWNYLKSRNITEDDILKYNIGYCDEGTYNNTIVIPSYDKDGRLNYFTTRSFDKYSKIKYKNPEASRNIIPFELFINWDLPIILCEGPFDAIAIKRNAIPLFGKEIQSELMKKIISSKVKKIYIALDKDAIKKAIQSAEYLLNQGKEVYLVELNDKDPSKLGFVEFTKYIQTVTELTQYNLIEKKLNLVC